MGMETHQQTKAGCFYYSTDAILTAHNVGETWITCHPIFILYMCILLCDIKGVKCAQSGAVIILLPKFLTRLFWNRIYD